LPISDIVDARPSVHDWRSAGLFVEQALTPLLPNVVAADRENRRTPTRQDFALSPQSSGLFVSTSSES
jgi:hypothetical protein